MAGRPMIPGGPTDAVAKSGGHALYLQLATLLAGHRMDHVIYALTRELGGVGIIMGETIEEARKCVDILAGDAKNIVNLNFDLHAEAVAAGQALGDRPTRPQ